MSAKSIAAFQASFPHRAPAQSPSITPSCYPRRHPTMPPPSAAVAGDEIIRHAADLVQAAQRILSRADELAESALRMGATLDSVGRYVTARKDIK